MEPKKGFIGVGIIILILIALGAAGYFAYQNMQPRNQVVPVPTTTATPTVTTDETANWKTLTLNKLQFKIPNSWWVERQIETGKEWSLVNPTSLSRPSDAVPAYQVTYEQGVSLDKKSQELKEAYPIETSREVTISVDSKPARQIEGVVPFGPLEGKKVRVVIMPKDGDVYYLSDFGLNSDFFNQILSTFKFLDNKSKFRLTGVFTTTTTQKEVDNFQEMLSRFGANANIMESIPLQFSIFNLSLEVCNLIKGEVNKLDYVSTHSECVEILPNPNPSNPVSPNQ